MMLTKIFDMIYKVSHYWVSDGKTPELKDIEDAIEAAKKEDCTVCLHWRGPGYRWFGDSYSRDVTADSEAQSIYDSLPKMYGL